MGMFKKIGKAVGGTVKKVGGAAFDIGKSTVKGAVKGVAAKLPGANMVSGLVGGLAKQVIPSGSSGSESAKKAGAIKNTQTVNVSKSKEKETGGEKKNIFKQFWDWMQQKKAEPKGAWIFWGILMLIGLLLIGVLWLLGRSFGFFRKKRSSGGRSYSYARRSKASSATISSGSKGKRRGLSPKQKAALAKGRAALRKKRGK